MNSAEGRPLVTTAEQRRILEQRLLAHNAADRPPEEMPTGVPFGPLSAAQQGLWLAHRLDRSATANNVAYHTRIEGTLEVATLRAAFAWVARRHPALRTAIAVDPEGSPTQVVQDSPVDLPFTDLGTWGTTQRNEELRRLAEDMSKQPFDLERAPLFRLRIVRIGEAEHILLIVFFHLIIDGLSANIVFRDLVRAYEAIRTGADTPAIPFLGPADIALKERPVASAELDYWRRRLAGHSGIWRALTDFPRRPHAVRQAGQVGFEIADDLAGRLRGVARQHGASTFMLYLAAATEVLSRFAGDPDLVLGVPVDHRDRLGAEDVVGLFADVLPVRLAHPGSSFSDLLRHVRAQVLGALEHRAVPFETLVRELRLPRHPGVSPVFQAVVSFVDDDNHAVPDSELKLSYADVDVPVIRCDVVIRITGTADGLSGFLEYDTNLFTADTARELAGRFMSLLDDVGRTGDVPLSPPERAPAATGTGAGHVGEDERGSVVAAGRMPETNAVRTLVRELWTEVLGAEDVDEEDSFLGLGGDSIGANQVVARIRKVLGAEVPLYEVLGALTLTEFADTVVSLLREPATDSETNPVVRTGEDVLSAAQARMWFSAALDPDVPLWTVPMIFEADGAVDLEALSSALTRVVARHEVLRRTFAVRRGHLTSVLHEPAEVIVETTELRPETGAQASEEVCQAWIRKQAHEVIDLAVSPLLRAHAGRIGADRWLLVINIHHIALDRWSVEILLAELSECYRGLLRGRPPQLDEPRLQYADFASWQRDWLAGPEARRQLDYWRRQLKLPAAEVELRFQRPRPTTRSRRSLFLAATIPSPVRGRVHELAGRETVTPFVVLFALFQVALYRAGAAAQFFVGVPTANRMRPEFEPLIGLFVNTLAMRVDLEGAETFRDVLGRVHRSSLEAFAHQDIPFDRLVEELKPKRSANRDPFYDVVFAYQNVPPGSGLSLPGVETRLIDNRYGYAKRDIHFILEEGPDGTDVLCEFDAELYAGVDARALVDDYLRLVAEVSGTPGGLDQPLMAFFAGRTETATGSAHEARARRIFDETADSGSTGGSEAVL